MVKKRADKSVITSPPPAPDPGPGADRVRVPAWLRTWGPLAVFMLVGLWLRLSVTMWTPIIHPDSMQYMRLAQEIRSGAFFRSDYQLDEGFIKSRRLPPLYAMLIAPFAQTQADLEKVGITLSLTLSTLAFIPFFFAARRAFSERAALLATALFTFNNFAIWWAYPILTEPLFTFLFVAVIYVSLEALVRPRLGWFIAAGALSALLYMTRDVGITAAPLVMAAAGLKFKLHDRLPWSRTAVLIGAGGLAFMTAASPYFIHIRARTGHWGLTAQMDNTSITKQIKAVGGDRWDRDQIGGEKIHYLGSEGDESVLGLARIIPSLVGKALRNLGQYGLELIKRMNLFLLVPLVIGLAGIAREFRKTRDRLRLILQVFLVVWLVQLWGLYSLITPYMVDERYMYPLCAPYLMLAGFGIAVAMEWLIQAAAPAPDRARAPAPSWLAIAAVVVTFTLATVIGLVVSAFYGLPRTPVIAVMVVVAAGAGAAVIRRDRVRGVESAILVILPLAAVLFFLLEPVLIHSQVISYFRRTYESASPILQYAYPGTLVVFTLALVPAAGALRRRWLGRGRRVEVLTALAIAATAAAAPIAWQLSPGGLAQIAVTLPAGLGLAVLALAAIGPDGPSRRWPVPVLSIIIMAAAYVSQVPDYMDLRDRIGNVANKYTAGHKEAAREIKKLGLIGPGKMFVSRKPFLAYYLDGYWYLDKEKNESLPKDMKELLQLLGSGKIDYLAADSFTLKSLRTQLSPLAYAMTPVPGCRLIYSHYFPQYGRIISVYDARAEETPIPPGTAAEHLGRAELYQRDGNLPAAYRELEAALAREPDSKPAWQLRLGILQIYYRSAYVRENPTLIFFPELLPALLQAAQTYSDLAPDDRLAAESLRQAREYARLETAEIERRKAEMKNRQQPAPPGGYNPKE